METENGWRNYLAEVPDLDMAMRALVRERAIREIMAETGEPREIVEQIDAASMGQETVLELTEGQPTTLRAALTLYTEQIRRGNGAVGDDLPTIADELTDILNFPYPDPVARHRCAHCPAEFSDAETARTHVRVTHYGLGPERGTDG